MTYKERVDIIIYGSDAILSVNPDMVVSLRPGDGPTDALLELAHYDVRQWSESGNPSKLAVLKTTTIPVLHPDGIEGIQRLLQGGPAQAVVDEMNLALLLDGSYPGLRFSL